jgi:hypothetical protein
MISRRTVVGAFVVLLALTAIVLLFIPVVHIDQQTADRIQPGMTADEVAAIIGGPPGYYDGVTDTEWKDNESWPKARRWFGRNGEIRVMFDGKGGGTKAAFFPDLSPGQSPVKLVGERWTRHAFGTSRRERAAAEGWLIGLLVSWPLVAIMVIGRDRGWGRGRYLKWLAVSGVTAVLIVLALSVWAEPRGDEAAGMFVAGTVSVAITFLGATVFALKHGRPKPAAAPEV